MSNTSVFYPGILRPIVFPLDDGQFAVSTVTTAAWNVNQRISVQKRSTWNIPAYGISTQLQTAFNTLSRLHIDRSYITYGIDHPIVWPVDIHDFIPQFSWNIDHRISASKRVTWDVSQRINFKKKFTWDVLQSEYASSSFSWNVRKRVFVEGVTAGYWTNELDTPIVHPIAYHNSTINPAYQWHLNQRLSVNRSVKFNVRIPASALKKFSFNTLSLTVTKQLSASWNLRKKISPVTAILWRMNSRFHVNKNIEWQLRSSLFSRKAISWKIRNNLSKQSSYTWEVMQRLQRQQTAKFNVHSVVRSQKTLKWNNLLREQIRNWQVIYYPGNIQTGIVHPIDFRSPGLQPLTYKTINLPVMRPISYQINNGYSESVNPGIAWRLGINPSGRVQCQKAIAFQDLARVSITKRMTWNTSHRVSFGQNSEFNIYNLVSSKINTEWIIGNWVPSHIRQTSQVRMDFAY